MCVFISVKEKKIESQPIKICVDLLF